MAKKKKKRAAKKPAGKVTRRAIAKAMGFRSVESVQNWIRNGAPSETVEEFRAFYESHKNGSTGGDVDTSNLRKGLAAQRISFLREQTKKLQRRNRVEEGKLVNPKEILDTWLRIVDEWCQLIDRWPTEVITLMPTVCPHCNENLDIKRRLLPLLKQSVHQLRLDMSNSKGSE